MISQIHHALITGEQKILNKNELAAMKNYYVSNGKLMRKKKFDLDVEVVIEKGMRIDIIKRAHDSAGHFGTHYVFGKVFKDYWWPDLFSDVKSYIESCDICQRDSKKN